MLQDKLKLIGDAENPLMMLISASRVRPSAGSSKASSRNTIGRRELSLARWRFALGSQPAKARDIPAFAQLLVSETPSIDVLQQFASERLGLIDLAATLSDASLMDAIFEGILRCDEKTCR